MILTFGSKGAEVVTIQRKLMSLGYGLPQYGDDGDYGNETARAVRAFQNDNGIPITGSVDQITYNKIMGISPAISASTKPVQKSAIIEKIGPYTKHIAAALVLGIAAWQLSLPKSKRWF